MNKRKIGGAFEQIAAGHLAAAGARILETNFRCRLGEIDLIARDGEYLVFAEVKYRASGNCGEALEAVGSAKQRTIINVSQFYLLRHGYPMETLMRYDVVAIDAEPDGELRIRWLRDAFRAGF